MKPLGEVCDVIGGGTPSKENAAFYGGKIPWATVRDMRFEVLEQTEHSITREALESSSSNIIPAGNVVIATRVGLGKVCILARDTAINQDLRGIVPQDKKLSVGFLFYWLKFVSPRIIAEGTGATVQGVKLPFIKGLLIPIPPAREQERIVAILDQAFKGVADAMQNTNKCIADAKYLFSSAFERISVQPGGAPWKRATVADILAKSKGAMRTGPFGSQLLHSEFVTEGIAVLGIDNVVQNEFRWARNRFITSEKYQQLKRYRVSPGDVLISIMGTCGRCAVVPDDVPIAINTKHLCCITVDRTKCLPHYLHAYFLHHPVVKEFLGLRAKGSIMAGLNMGIIKELPVLLPTVQKQQEVLNQLDALERKTAKLESIEESKLAALIALNQSLLHQAFTGRLAQTPATAVIIPFPLSLPRIKSTDVHAGILAIAYQAHADGGKTALFGHVKAEKIAHMVEAWVGVDLGRTPVRDAAGPNDFPHLKKVEHRANLANYFTFTRQGDGAYKVTKKRGFDALVLRTRSALGEYNSKLNDLIRHMLPMDKTRAEIFSTVYAAWNNLLLESRDITDEAIVRAAREDWHADKLGIERQRFFKAIEWMRKENIVPEGKGKMVVAKA